MRESLDNFRIFTFWHYFLQYFVGLLQISRSQFPGSNYICIQIYNQCSFLLNITYGMALIYKRQYADQNTYIEKNVCI